MLSLGIGSICRMLATQPTACRSSDFGSSVSADFWVTRKTSPPSLEATSKARRERVRPTYREMAMRGKMTTSRSGRTGMAFLYFISVDTAGFFEDSDSIPSLWGRMGDFASVGDGAGSRFSGLG